MQAGGAGRAGTGLGRASHHRTGRPHLCAHAGGSHCSGHCVQLANNSAPAEFGGGHLLRLTWPPTQDSRLTCQTCDPSPHRWLWAPQRSYGCKYAPARHFAAAAQPRRSGGAIYLPHLTRAALYKGGWIYVGLCFITRSAQHDKGTVHDSKCVGQTRGSCAALCKELVNGCIIKVQLQAWGGRRVSLLPTRKVTACAYCSWLQKIKLLRIAATALPLHPATKLTTPPSSNPQPTRPTHTWMDTAMPMMGLEGMPLRGRAGCRRNASTRSA